MEEPIEPTAITTVYDGRIIRLQLETIALPTGGELKAEIIRHPGSVVIVPVTDLGEIVLVKQYRHAVGRRIWELPAGSLKPGENAADAAHRECHEETGLVPGQLASLGSFYPTPGYCDEKMTFYLATSLREPGPDDSAQPDEDEDIETGRFSVDQVADMVRTGEIIDLKTVAALAMLRR